MMHINLRSERGSLLIVVALSLVMLLGFAGLSIDASYMYDKRNQLSAAADAAAKSGALEVYRDPAVCDQPANLKAYADQQVVMHGFDPTGQTVVSIVCPPANGPFAGNRAYVEAIVLEPTPTFFGKVLGWNSATPGARAVAGTSSGPNCIVVFDHVTFSNPAASNLVTMPHCSMVIGGSTSPTSPAITDLFNQATINAHLIGVAHLAAVGCLNNCGNVTYGVTPPGDPLATLPPLPAPVGSTCTAPYEVLVSQTITALDLNSYMCGFHLHNNTVLTFASGLYYINGPITDSTGAGVGLAGDGVMLFLSPAASIQMVSSNGVTITMTAPTSGTYNGILFYQDRNTPLGTTAVFGSNNTDLTVQGAFYFPTATIQMTNENNPSLSNPCTLIVAWGIEITKPHFQLDNVCGAFGGSPLMTVSMGE